MCGGCVNWASRSVVKDAAGHTPDQTPTLFLGGEKDFNVPIVGGEQMYQALLLLGVPSGMVVSPRQFHGISRPSFVKDRYDRYLAWYGKYLMGVAQ